MLEKKDEVYLVNYLTLWKGNENVLTIDATLK